MPRRDGVAIALAAFVVYAVGGREAWHGIDMLALLNEMHRGVDSHPYYGFFPALLRTMQAVTTPFGSGIHRGGLLAGAIGTAVGVGCVHAAGRRLGLSRTTAAFAALVMATLPGIVYFAVVLEVHGHLLACCGLVWVLMARWAVDPRPARAVAVGIGLCVAALAHPLAAMTGAAMVPIAALASPAPRWRARWLGFALAFVTLLAFLLVWLVVLPQCGLADASHAAGDEVRARLSRYLRVATSSLGVSVVREWLVPCFPASAVVLGLALCRRARGAAVATLAATLPFLLVSWLILWVDECGAYVTMAAGPLALTAAAHLRSTRLRFGYLAVAVAAAAWFQGRLQVTPEAAATAAAVQAAVGDREMAWLVGDGAGPDGQVWLTRRPASHVVVLADLLTLPMPRVETALAAIGADIDARGRAGVPTLVTSTTLGTLAMLAPAHDVARTIHAWLLARRGTELGAADGVTVFEVRGG